MLIGFVSDIQQKVSTMITLNCLNLLADTTTLGIDGEYTLNAHQDSGAIERWEDPMYKSCYEDIFKGKWEQYDAWNADCRPEAKTDLYQLGGEFYLTISSSKRIN